MIQLIDLIKEYRSVDSPTVVALKNINLQLPERGMVFILGKSGSGKSTLLNVIGGLDTYEGGDLIINGVSTKNFTAKEFDDYRNNCVGFVFQEFHLLENYTVGKNVSLPLELQRSKNKDMLVRRALEQVDLKGYESRKASALSGGQKQRIAIARALVKAPQIILADEPSGNLDSETGEQIFSLLKKLSEQRLIIVVTHDRDAAMRFGDRVIEISDGTITQQSIFSESQGVTPITPTVKKAALPFKNILSLSLANFKFKKIRLILTALLFSLTLTFFLLGTTSLFFQWDKASLKIYQSVGEDTIVFVQDPLPTTNAQYDATIMPWRNKQKIEEYNKDFEFIPFYCRGKNLWSNLSELKDYHPLYYHYTDFIKYAAFDEHAYAEYGIKIVAGSAPQNAYEIVLPIYLYESFEAYGYKGAAVNGSDDILNKNIYMPDIKKTLTIVGIADTGFKTDAYTELKNVEAEFLTYSESHRLAVLNGELHEEVNLFFHSAVLVNQQFVDLHLKGNFESYHNAQFDRLDYEVTDSGIINTPAISAKNLIGQSLNFALSSNYTVTRIKGQGELVGNEVIVPFILAEQYTKGLMPYYLENNMVMQQSITTEDINQRIIDGMTLRIATQNLSDASYLERKEYTVVGYWTNPNSDPFSQIDYILMEDNALIDFSNGDKRVMAMVTKLSGDKQKDLALLHFAFNNNVDDLVYFKLSGKYGEQISSAHRISTAYKKLGFYCSLGLGIFSIVMMLNFISYSISNKKKDIGILRAIGTKSRDIFLIFFCEGAVIAFISFVAACIIGYVLMWIINIRLAAEGLLVKLFNFDYKAILLTLALAAFIAATGCLLPLIRILRKKPVEIIQNAQ
jgi:ABC-type lipoprotein export system ATPase subunit/ABC-type antimicrobial peptide transport system permease subunit